MENLNIEFVYTVPDLLRGLVLKNKEYCCSDCFLYVASLRTILALHRSISIFKVGNTRMSFQKQTTKNKISSKKQAK